MSAQSPPFSITVINYSHYELISKCQESKLTSEGELTFQTQVTHPNVSYPKNPYCLTQEFMQFSFQQEEYDYEGRSQLAFYEWKLPLNTLKHEVHAALKSKGLNPKSHSITEIFLGVEQSSYSEYPQFDIAAIHSDRDQCLTQHPLQQKRFTVLRSAYELPPCVQDESGLPLLEVSSPDVLPALAKEAPEEHIVEEQFFRDFQTPPPNKQSSCNLSPKSPPLTFRSPKKSQQRKKLQSPYPKSRPGKNESIPKENLVNFGLLDQLTPPLTPPVQPHVELEARMKTYCGKGDWDEILLDEEL